MRARVALLGAGIAVLPLAGSCIGAPTAPNRPVPAAPGDVMVGVRPGLPPLKTTPSPFLRTPSESRATETPTPTPAAVTSTPTAES